jgi:phage replication-related protein YjqB (UPF0714/DUF867 family)
MVPGGCEAQDGAMNNRLRNRIFSAMQESRQTVEQLMADAQESFEIQRFFVGRSPIAVLAPHAGTIEPLTGELALAIAGRLHRFYGFSGKLTRDAARGQISPLRFDELNLHDVLRGARTAIAIHGTAGDEDAVSLIGGCNLRLMEAIRYRLETAGFAVMGCPLAAEANDPRNVVNRVPEGGVHIELTQRQRDDLRGGWFRRLRFEAYAHAIRTALTEEMDRPGPSWDQIRVQSASPAL